jgi:lipoprotein-releasing system ATP-binding protein
VNQPEIVFCDEPTGNLDDETASVVFGLLTAIHREGGVAFVIVTHDERMARQFESVYRLQEGVLIRENTREQEKSTHGT